MALFFATISPVPMLLLGILLCNFKIIGGQSIGVCNGMIADNLPAAEEVINLYKSNGITKMRLYFPHQPTLQVLRSSGIDLILDVPRENLQALAADAIAAAEWVSTNVAAFSPGVNFRYISVGNEILPSDSLAQHVLPAMQNMNAALAAANLHQVKVSTTTFASLLGTSFPPSTGAFSAAAIPFIEPIIQFLAANGSPLLANVYTYFSYVGDPQNVALPYALFTSPGVNVRDGERGYQNLFDATLDAFYSAVERAGGNDMDVVVAESGWPSAGGTAATVENARTYYRNLVSHVKGGTPKRPGRAVETYLFAMFDENQKGGAETERHYGLFSPNKQPKYQISFS